MQAKMHKYNNEKNMNSIQKQIEDADRELVQALETRLELEIQRQRLHELGPTRQNVEEQSVEEKSCDEQRTGPQPLQLGHRLVNRKFAQTLFGQISHEASVLTAEHVKLVGFQGAHGAFSDVATRQLVPEGIPIPNLSFADVFCGVDKGYYDLGVVPVENSLEGAVTEVNELLTKTDLKVIGETVLNIDHCLLVAPDTQISEVRVAYSHPQALAQCRGFLMKRQIEARPFFDTAGAAQMIARKRPRAACAIASSLSGDLYGLKVVERGIADNQANSTRFLLISRELSTSSPDGKSEDEKSGDKISIVFATDHRAGALFNVLRLFAERGINLTRIASMPRRSDPGNYDFFLDFEGSSDDEAIERVLQLVAERTASFRFLGCYRKV